MVPAVMGNRLFIGNLSWEATEDELRLFLGGDTVTSVKIISDRETGRSRGFGFVEMSDDDEAKRVITELDGRLFGGRELRINEAHEKEQRPRSSSGGGGGGYQGRSGPPPRDDGPPVEEKRRGKGSRRRGRDQDDYGGGGW